MKTYHETTEVESNGVFKTSSFKFAQSAKIFRILSDGLYSDKIGSIVREIICNGFDSHVQAGHPEMPVEVYLPTEIDPNFKVVDHGVGLSPDEVTEIYTTYGASTKDDSNDVIGAFGLGSKSPFSYAETFALTAIKDGMKSHYTAFIDDDGYPKITSPISEPTDERNGVMVTIPFLHADFDELTRKARKFLENAISPALLNGCQVTRNVDHVIYEGKNANIVKDRRSHRGSQFTVRMGDVLYPITEKDILGCFDDIEEREVASSFIRKISYNDHGIAFNVKIGDIDVSSSRETVAFTKRTAGVIYDAAWSVISSYRKTTIEAFNAALTANRKWDANIAGKEVIQTKLKNFFTDSEISEHYKRIASPSMPWTSFAKAKLGVYIFGSGRRTANVMLGNSSEDTLRKGTGMICREDEIVFNKPSDGYLFFFETRDMRRNLGELSEYFAMNHRNKRVIYVTPVSNVKEDRAMYDRFVRRAKRNLGLTSDYLLDEIKEDKAPKAPRVKGVYSGWKAHVYTKGASSYSGPKYNQRITKVEDHTFFDGKVVAPRDKDGRITDPRGRRWTPRDIMDTVVKLFGRSVEFVVLPPTVYKKIDKEAGFANATKLNDYIWQAYEDLYLERNIDAFALITLKTKAIENIAAWSRYGEQYHEDFFYQVDDREFVEAFGRAGNLNIERYGSPKMERWMRAIIDNVPEKMKNGYLGVLNVRRSEIKELIALYPLLDNVSTDLEAMMPEIVEYMNHKFSMRSQAQSA